MKPEFKMFEPRRAFRRGYSATRSVIQRKSIQWQHFREDIYSHSGYLSVYRYSRIDEPISDHTDTSKLVASKLWNDMVFKKLALSKRNSLMLVT